MSLSEQSVPTTPNFRAVIIAPHADSTWRLVQPTVQNALKASKFEPWLLEKDVEAGAVWINAVTNAIQKSDIVVADVTNLDPNSFYELGFAYALRIPTILLVNTEQNPKLPAALSGYHFIPYNSGELDALGKRIKRAADMQFKRFNPEP